jgi:hypothetical protein
MAVVLMATSLGSRCHLIILPRVTGDK